MSSTVFLPRLDVLHLIGDRLVPENTSEMATEIFNSMLADGLIRAAGNGLFGVEEVDDAAWALRAAKARVAVLTAAATS